MDELLTPISKVFAHKLLRIPDYQRGYAWGERQWDDFLSDLEYLPKEKMHFTGTVVLHAREGQSNQFQDNQFNTYTVFDIVDGQQRFTTAVLFLDVLRREMMKFEHLIGFAEGVQNNYIEILDRNNQPIPRLALNRDCQDFFYHTVLERGTNIQGPTIPSHILLIKAKEYFSSYLSQKEAVLGETYPEYLDQMLYKVTQQLGLIVYPIKKETDAGVIFESMNDRGKSISELEKIKNFLIYRAGTINVPDDHNLVESINNTWTYIFERLMIAGLVRRAVEDQFIRAFWLMAYNYDPRNWDGARSLKGQFSLERYHDVEDDILLSDLLQFLEILKAAATAYCDVLNPTHSDAFRGYQLSSELQMEIIEESDRFARLETTAGFLPLLMAARIRFPNDGKAYLDLVRLCEKYAFRVYRWLGSQVRRGQTRLFRMGYDLFQHGDLENIIHGLERMVQRDCSDSQFKARFQNEDINWYRWYGIKYFLYEYETHLANEAGTPVRMPWKYLAKSKKEDTIEHILPQAPDPDGYWEKRFDMDNYERYTHDIGNLTLTYDNSSLGNKPFPEKKGSPSQPRCYASSKLFVEQQIAGYDDWTEDTILSRRKEIEAWTLQRWQVNQPPPEVKSFTEPMEKMLAVADRNGVGPEIRAILKAVEPLPLEPIALKHCIKFCPRFNLILSAFTVQPDNGFFWFHMRPWNLAKFKGADQEEIFRLFGKEEWQRKQKEDVYEFIENLESFFAGLELAAGK